MNRITRAILIATAVLAAGVTKASAYSTYTVVSTMTGCSSMQDSSGQGLKLKWSENAVRLHIHGTSFPIGSAYAAALEEVTSTWNANPSNFAFSSPSFYPSNQPNVGVNNGRSEVWFSTNQAILSGAPAITLFWFSCNGNLTEADVIFDSSVAWNPSNVSKKQLLPYGGSDRPFQTTAMHEFGHALGLGHENRVYNIMGEDWTHIHANGGTTRAYPGADASAGAVSLYGLRTGYMEDVGVVHWRYVNASGEYSHHDRTRMFDMSGVQLSGFVDAGEPRYLVAAGQTILLELTYENNGRSTQSPTVQFYLSINDFISSSDTPLGSTTLTLVPDTTLTTMHLVTLPTWLVAGADYYIGARIDATSLIGEVAEDNNATYIGVRMSCPPRRALCGVLPPLPSTTLAP
jgi:matrixin